MLAHRKLGMSRMFFIRTSKALRLVLSDAHSDRTQTLDGCNAITTTLMDIELIAQLMTQLGHPLNFCCTASSTSPIGALDS